MKKILIKPQSTRSTQRKLYFYSFKALYSYMLCFKYRFSVFSVFSVVILILLFSLCLAGCERREAHIILAGSTSVQPYAEVLDEEFILLYPDSAIDIQGGGSSAGITAVQSGTADIGMSSRSLTDKEESLWSCEIAKDGLAIIVHPLNPVQKLTLGEICDIYSAKITDWSELGGTNAKIHIIAREEGSGTRSAFESLVMTNSQITAKAIVQDSNGSVRQLVSGDKNSIGFISLGLVDHTVKAMPLNGVAPTRENVINGSYSLWRPFLFVTEKEPLGSVKQFIDFILSEEGQQILVNEGLINGSDAVSGFGN